MADQPSDEADGLRDLEDAFVVAGTPPMAKASWITGVALVLLAGPIVGGIAGVVLASHGDDSIWAFVLLPYLALLGALAGAFAAVGTVLLKRVMRRESYVADVISALAGTLVGAFVVLAVFYFRAPLVGVPMLLGTTIWVGLPLALILVVARAARRRFDYVTHA